MINAEDAESFAEGRRGSFSAEFVELRADDEPAPESFGSGPGLQHREELLKIAQGLNALHGFRKSILERFESLGK